MGSPTNRDLTSPGPGGTGLAAAAAVSVLGVLLAGTVSRDVGGPVVVVGWLAFLYALHRFGRVGA
jgi:hypothetical protein